MRILHNCSLLVAFCLIKLRNFICFKTTNGGHMFSFIAGKLLGVFMNFFALYIPHFHEYNGVIFELKIQTWIFTLCLLYLNYYASQCQMPW